jgi:hypothetical protein
VPLALRWIQLELVGVGTAPLEAAVRAERERRGPDTRRLGITSRMRFGHVPVFVPAPGIVRLDWLGRGLLRALEAHTTAAEPLELDLRAEPDLDRRLADLVRRGDRVRAIALAQREQGLSLLAAREHVDALGRDAA